MDEVHDRILSLRPLAYWPLHDPGVWSDVSGNGLHLSQAGGIIGSAPSIVEESTRTCADFSTNNTTGTGGWLYSTSSALCFETMTKGFTVIQTFQPYKATEYAILMTKEKFYVIIETSSNRLIWPNMVGSTNTAQMQPILTQTNSYGSPYTVAFATVPYLTFSFAFVYDPSDAANQNRPTIRAYNYCTQYDPVTITSWQGWGSVDTSANEFRLGASTNAPTSWSYRFGGKMQDVAIYDYPLTKGQLTILCGAEIPNITAGLDAKNRAFVH